MDNRVLGAFREVVQAFESGKVADAVAIQLYYRDAIFPSDKWSFANRLLQAFAGTSDARGVKQWNAAGRRIKKGSRAFYILAPRMIKAKAENGTDEDSIRLAGFFGVPVFRYEDTEGAPIEGHADITPPQPPRYIEVARAWDIDVTYAPTSRGERGAYCTATDSIRLSTAHEKTFLHELAHAAQSRLGLLTGAAWRVECSAELAAAAIGRTLGLDTEGNSYQYIRHFAGIAGKSVSAACLDVMRDVEQIITAITDTAARVAEI